MSTMNPTQLPPARTAPDEKDNSLDARIWRAEQRLIAREQRLRGHAQELTRRVKRVMEPQRLLVPVATAGVAAVALLGLWRSRRGPARAMGAMPFSGTHAAGGAGGTSTTGSGGQPAHRGELPWVRMLGLAWPLMPARLRERVSPATATTVLGFGLPIVERLLAKRTAPPLATMASVDLVQFAGTWFEVAHLPQPLQRRPAVPPRVRYLPRRDGRIDVLTRERTGDDDAPSSTQALAQPVPGSGGARLKITTWPPALQWLQMAWSDHWILHVDDDYTEALVGNPSRDRLVLLSRRRTLRPARVNALVQIAQDRGFAVERLQFFD